MPLTLDAPRMAPLGVVPAVAAAHLALMGALCWAWLVISGAPHGAFEALVCAAPAALVCGLGFTSQADRQQYAVRLVACAAMLPILLLMWTGEQDAPADAAAGELLTRRSWIFFVGAALVHAAGFLAAIVFLAGTVTRVEAARGSVRVPAMLLVQRLQSLAAAGVPFDVSAGATPDECAVTLRNAAARRNHRVLLQIDEGACRVRVRERLGADGAAPHDADEASMRALGDPIVDAARPDAQRVSARVAQASMIDPARLGAIRLVLHDGRADLQAPTAPNEDDVVAILCAVVTRSGYAWQPLLFSGAAAATKR